MFIVQHIRSIDLRHPENIDRYLLGGRATCDSPNNKIPLGAGTSLLDSLDVRNVRYIIITDRGE